MVEFARRVVLLARARAALRSPPDLDALRRAPDPDSFARLVLVPAARNLGVAAFLLPPPMRAEATAAFLACRVLDAFEDLGVNHPERTDGAERAERCRRLLAALDYLRGQPTPPVPLPVPVPLEDASDAVDALLVERVSDVRQLLLTLEPDRRARVESMLADIGGIMARNLEHPIPREQYSRRVLGRVTRYACDLVAARPLATPEQCEFVGVLVQMANDLRDRECEHYGVATAEELTRHIFLRMAQLTVPAFAFLADLGSATRSRGARAATAYLAVTTAGFLCRAAGAPPPYRRPGLAALLAAIGPRGYRWALRRVGEAANRAVTQAMTPASPAQRDPQATFTLVDVLTTGGLPATGNELLVAAAFRLVGDLPRDRLSADLAGTAGRRLMLADHLAFGALDQIRPDDTQQVRDLAILIQLMAHKGAQA
jgi:hypothetical protein